MRTRFPGLGLLAASVLLGFANPAVSGYTFSLLDTLGATHGSARAINNAGQVVGYSSLTGDGDYHATLWNGTGATDLGTLGGSNSIAFAINNAGQVVGDSSQITGGWSHATLWNSGTAIGLSALAGYSGHSRAYAINSAGHVVGTSDNGDFGESRATLWSGATATGLGTPGINSFATGINDSGQVVGGLDRRPPYYPRHPVEWQH